MSTGGTSDEMKVQMAPLMTEYQRYVLEQLLKAAMTSMTNFPLGGAYGGPYSSSYSPMTFMPGPQPYSDWSREDEKRKQEEKERERKTREGNGDENGRRGEKDRDTNNAAAGTSAYSPLLAGTPMRQFTPLPQSMEQSIIPRLLSSPIMRPFIEGMTGNYPRIGRY